MGPVLRRMPVMILKYNNNHYHNQIHYNNDYSDDNNRTKSESFMRKG